MPPVADTRLGAKLAEGRYVILAQIGEGSMGRVYLARDLHLETLVVIKFPMSGRTALDQPELLERFTRETRSLVRLSHPHIIKIIDVGTEDDQPFVVLQYLAGGSLKDRLKYGRTGPLPMPAESLWTWLRDVARALDFIHAQGHIHRDVKPANILFDLHGNAFLSDFGIIKSLEAADEGSGQGASSLTAPGFLLGTPNYVAPEIVLGQRADGRSDQYSLALTIHELLTGRNSMVGPSPSATLVNQTKTLPSPLSELVPGLSPRLCAATLRALSKEPADRFASCSELAEEVLADLPPWKPAAPPADLPSLACPLCLRPLELPADEVLTSVECPRCRQTSALESSAAGPRLVRSDEPTVPTPPADPGTGNWIGWTGTFLSGPGIPGSASATARLPGPVPPPASRRVRHVGIAATVVLLGSALAWWVAQPAQTPPAPAAQGKYVAARPASPVEPGPTTINIAYGTEKRRWLESALADFTASPEGHGITINLIGMGSVEGADAVLNGPGETPIHVWSPASSAYRDMFEREWAVRRGGSPIQHAADLALTPMVFVLWKPRADAFLAKYGKLDFKTLASAMREPAGWGAIADRAEWGLFKFAHTDPSRSNSGLLALVLMAYQHAGKQRGLTLQDVTSSEFQAFLEQFERGITRHAGRLTHSTGTLMEEMVKRGPSQYDGLLLYENLAIDFLEAARDNWGDQADLSVHYPDPNIWNEHPYYILDVPWSTTEHRRAASQFLAFLLSEPVQRKALQHGFRPANTSVPVHSADSPLLPTAARGISLDLPRIAEPPSADVVQALIGSFRRIDR